MGQPKNSVVVIRPDKPILWLGDIDSSTKAAIQKDSSFWAAEGGGVILFDNPAKQSIIITTHIEDTITNYWMSPQQSRILKSAKIVYKKPTGFKEVKGMECFSKLKDSPRLASILSCEGNQLLSDDEHFLSFISFIGIPDRNVIKRSHFQWDNAYMGQIRALILHSLGKDASVKGENADFDWKQYVNYYTPEETKSKFNADTAISFHLLTLTPNEFYKGKYKYLDALFLQKNGIGYAAFYCFYDEAGQKKLKKYRSAIKTVLRYNDL